MRGVRGAVAGIAVAAMTLGVAAPAGAQEDEGPASLGFAVDKTQAQPGILVLGKVDTDDVAEHCTTDVEEFQARWIEMLQVLGGDAYFEHFFPEDGPAVSDGTHERYAAAFTFFVAFGAAQVLEEEVHPETFVMTFADIATQAPVGERDTFDPAVGEASVVVPEVEPGLWAVAATCVGPIVDFDALIAATETNAEFLREIGMPVQEPGEEIFPIPASQELTEFMQEFADSDRTGNALFRDFLTAIGPNLIEPLLTPDAFGAVLFCILDPEGNCPADEPPAPPPGEPIEPSRKEEPTAAQPVVAVPSFTG